MKGPLISNLCEPVTRRHSQCIKMAKTIKSRPVQFVKRMSSFLPHRFLAMALVASCASPVALAVEFGGEQWQGSLDTSLSWGVRSRLDDPDPDIVGIPNGGNAFSVNGDDGNLNFGTGIVSNAFKLTSELLLEKDNFGGFFRVTGFYDDEVMNGNREKAELSDTAKDIVGRDAEVLDAYVWYGFDLGDKAAEVRLGNQVLSWGESTYIQNSINTINPINVARIRVPGAELREALMPVPILSSTFDVTENGSLEAFLQLAWEETRIDPPGSYFSSNDFAGPGGERVQLGFGGVGEGPFLGISRAADKKPADSGQFGLAYRTFMPNWNDTEFGFYYINYHSRLPIISARTGTNAGLAAAGQVYATAGVAPGSNAVVDANATQAYSQTARYQIEYPEDIQLLGLSFNTTASGWALQGEISHRLDVPLQVDDVELLFAALSPFNPGLTANQMSQFLNDGNAYAASQDIPGFILRDVTQLQVTATRLFPNVLGATQFLLLGEVGVNFVNDMPSKDELRLEAPGTYISGNQTLAGAHGPAAGQFEDARHFADATSWGYRLVTRLQFDNAIGGWNILPRLVFAQDVSGNSPGPGGSFLEGRRAATLGLTGDYQSTWAVDLSYTQYSGAGRYNLINDRDFMAFNVKYAF